MGLPDIAVILNLSCIINMATNCIITLHEDSYPNVSQIQSCP